MAEKLNTIKKGFRELLAYQKGFDLAMEIFEVSKMFPIEEKYSLTDQIRRSSRSVCANIGEGYRKRQYPAHFVSKISDSDMKNSETQVWLDFALAFNYIDTNTFNELIDKSEEVGRLLSFMIQNPDKFR